jgi:hypothetical protein
MFADKCAQISRPEVMLTAVEKGGGFEMLGDSQRVDDPFVVGTHGLFGARINGEN